MLRGFLVMLWIKAVKMKLCEQWRLNEIESNEVWKFTDKMHHRKSICTRSNAQWRNDGVAAASTLVTGVPTGWGHDKEGKDWIWGVPTPDVRKWRGPADGSVTHLPMRTDAEWYLRDLFTLGLYTSLTNFLSSYITSFYYKRNITENNQINSIFLWPSLIKFYFFVLCFISFKQIVVRWKPIRWAYSTLHP